jgi:malonyl-CoA O-methyltransferase
VSIDKVQVMHRFNRSAATYDQYAGIQQQMASALLQHVQQLPPRPIQRICEIGCGTGYMTQLLLRQFPQARLVAIDLAPQMIERAQAKIPSTQVDWVIGDAERWETYDFDCFDLIVSNATIQWLSDLKHSLRLWRDALHPKGWFVAATFGIDTFQELSTLFQEVELELGMRHDRHHLPLHAAQCWQQLLQQVGFTTVTVAENWQRIQYPDCRTLLQTIKGMGASYSEATSPSAIHRRLLPTLLQRYDDQYRIGSQVYATYHVLQLYGQK